MKVVVIVQKRINLSTILISVAKTLGAYMEEVSGMEKRYKVKLLLKVGSLDMVENIRRKIEQDVGVSIIAMHVVEIDDKKKYKGNGGING